MPGPPKPKPPNEGKGKGHSVPVNNPKVTFHQEVTVSKFEPIDYDSNHKDSQDSSLDQAISKARRKSNLMVHRESMKGGVLDSGTSSEAQLNETTTVQDKAGKVLDMLQGEDFFKMPLKKSPDDEFVDPLTQMQNAHLFLAQNSKRTEWEEEENPTEEYLEEKEKKRLERLKTNRGACLTKSFIVIFHLGALLNFLISLVLSFSLIVVEARFQALLIRGDYNCLDIVPHANWMEHLVNIFHALMSACVVYADNKVNAGLCMAYVFVQAIHSSFNAFTFFMQMRFDEDGYFWGKFSVLTVQIMLDIFTSIVVIQKFYDLTDRVRYRAQRFSSQISEGMSMNDDIIYLNQSSFLQRKHILREAIASQVYSVIQKIGNYRNKGLEPDHVAIYRELHAAKTALQDVDAVDNSDMLKELKKANGKRLKEYDADPSRLQGDSIVKGSMSKLFLMEFKERLLPMKPDSPIAEYAENESLKP